MKNEQELFEEIASVLHHHEDAYQPGAWEAFARTKKRRRGIVYLRIAAAAAVLLLVGYAAWQLMPAKKIGETTQQTNNKTNPPYIYPKNNHGADSLVTEQAIASRQNTQARLPESKPPYSPARAATNETTQVISVGVEATAAVTAKPAELEKNGKISDSAPVIPVKPDEKAVATQPGVIYNNEQPVAPAQPRRYERGSQLLSYDSLANLNKSKPLMAETKKNKVLSYGVMVSPSVGNQKMNFGTGLEVSYNISKNFALSSGISYAYINSGSNKNGGIPAEGTQSNLRGYNASFASSSVASSFSTSSYRTVQSVQLTLSGVELPLNFQYKAKSGFYVSAGVSAMSVIRNNISYNYLDSRTVNTPSANGLSSTISVQTETTTQQSNEALTGFIGFYTLSAGKKINFGKGKLNFAPFIKVPFNRVSSENLQLLHGGVQLGFGF